MKSKRAKQIKRKREKKKKEEGKRRKTTSMSVIPEVLLLNIQADWIL